MAPNGGHPFTGGKSVDELKVTLNLTLENIMIVKTITAGLAVLFLSGTAYSQEMKMCDDKTFEMVRMEVEKAPADKKEMAMAELMMAKEKMEGKMTKECSTHLEKASKASMKQ